MAGFCVCIAIIVSVHHERRRRNQARVDVRALRLFEWRSPPPIILDEAGSYIACAHGDLFGAAHLISHYITHDIASVLVYKYQTSPRGAKGRGEWDDDRDSWRP